MALRTGEHFVTCLTDWEQKKSPHASLVAQTVKRLPTMRETLVRSLGWENPLEKEMATYSSILAWEIPGQRRLLNSLWDHEELDMT